MTNSLRNIMSTKISWSALLIGNRVNFSRGECDSFQSKVFCIGKGFMDGTCFKSSKRHVDRCSERWRWINGDKCLFPQIQKSCSFWHPELGKRKVKIKDPKDQVPITLHKGLFMNYIIFFQGVPDPHLPPCHLVSSFGLTPPTPYLDDAIYE